MTLRLVEGAYGIAVVDARQPDRIVVARNGSPVLLAIGAREMLVASDAAAVVRHTDQVVTRSTPPRRRVAGQQAGA